MDSRREMTVKKNDSGGWISNDVVVFWLVRRQNEDVIE
jgi:hypothetical protein